MTTSGLVGGVGGGLAIGSVGVVKAPLTPAGSIYAAGEEWSARTADLGSLERGDSVRVIGLDGLTAIVEPDASSSSQP